MFIIVQFPFADTRKVGEGANERMAKPDWSSPFPSGFIRNFGQLRKRKQSASGAAGEHTYAVIEKALLFRNPITYRETDWSADVKIVPWYRRMYFDGVVSGRFEVGFWVDTGPSRTAGAHGDLMFHAEALVNSLLCTIVNVEFSNKRSEPTQFQRCGQTLLEAYVEATTSNEGMLSSDLTKLTREQVVIGDALLHLRFATGTGFVSDRSTVHLSGKFGADHFFKEVSTQRGSVNCLITQSKDMDPFTEHPDERAARVIFSHLRMLTHAAHVVGTNGTGSYNKPALLQATETMLKRLKQWSVDLETDVGTPGLDLFSSVHEGALERIVELIDDLAKELNRPNAFQKMKSFVEWTYEIAVKQAVETSMNYGLKSGGP